DLGLGIKKEDISRIFEKGYTGENGNTSFKSTGLGLYICKKLSDLLNISIEVESVEKEYSIFRLVFNNN
ncbi:MAG: ATP-binding protein, partial [Anaeroplasmataceae bacterium]